MTEELNNLPSFQKFELSPEIDFSGKSNDLYEKTKFNERNKNNEYLTTYNWSMKPKNFVGPRKYHRKNLFKIPTGSLYLASDKGPWADLNAQLTGSPYNLVGIVFQTKYLLNFPDFQGTQENNIQYETYVFILMFESIEVIRLESLIEDPQILSHSILPLKDLSFPENSNNSLNLTEDKLKNLRQDRVNILKELLQEYHDHQPKFDDYQTCLGMVSISFGSGKTNKITGPELIGKILFQTGLIWDNRFNTQGKNPVEFIDDQLFKNLSDQKSENVAKIIIRSPGTYNSLQNESSLNSSKNSDPLRSLRSSESSPTNSNLSNQEGFHPEIVYDPETMKVRVNLGNYFKQNQKIQPTPSFPKENISTNYTNSSKGECVLEGPFLSKKILYSSTINFRELRVVDFLVPYYENEGLNLQPIPIDSLAKKLKFLNPNLMTPSSSSSPLNMDWYHSRLIPIEKVENLHKNLKDLDYEQEYLKLNKIIKDISHNFVQKSLLQNDFKLTNYRLHRICQDLNLASSDLHRIASFTNANIHQINICQEDKNLTKPNILKLPVKTLDQFLENEEINFYLRCDQITTNFSTHEIQLLPYMRCRNWKYFWKSYIKLTDSEFRNILSQIHEIVNIFKKLSQQTPENCILYEIIFHLYLQSQRVYGYLKKSYKII